MPEALNKITEQFKDFWSSLDSSQKNRIYITSAVLAVCLAVSLFWLTRSEMVPIVSSSDSNEINEMRSILSENNIAHTLSGDKSSILVDVRDKNDAELAIAVEGYPKGGMNFEDAFSYIKINTTESDKAQIWKEYKKNSLIKKLMMFDDVIDADVELAQPEPSLFDSEIKTTAYVRIDSKSDLTPKQVKGIVMVVSRSVENLDPRNVTVVDNNANILNSETGSEWVEGTNVREDIRYKRRKELENSVYSLFRTPSDNFDYIQVVANPYLDFDKRKVQTVDVQTPDGMDEGAVTESEIISETQENMQDGGAPGVDTNPGETGVTSYQIGETGGSTSTKQEERKKYKYTESSIETERAVGYMIPKQSTMSVTLWWGHRVKDENKLSQDFLDQLLLNVSNATGIPIGNISVNKYKLAPKKEVKIGQADKFRSYVEDYGLFVLVLIMLTVLMFVLIPSRKRKEEMELETATAPGTSGPRFKVPEEDEPVPELDMEERSEVKKQIDKIINQKPEAVAQLLRNWLSEWD